MTSEEKLALACQTIREEISQLLTWAAESQSGGWSTHQVRPQQDRAGALALTLYRLES